MVAMQMDWLLEFVISCIKRDYIKNIPFEGRIYEDDDWMSQVLAKNRKNFL